MTGGILGGPPRGALARLARAPAWLYRHRLGWVLGSRFLAIEHVGRKTGRVHHSVVEVVAHDLDLDEYRVVAAWGRRSDWYQNIRARPALHVTVGRRRFVPSQRRLEEDEAVRVLASYRRRHPYAFRWLARSLGYAAASGDEGVRLFARSAPMIGFSPLDPRTPTVTASTTSDFT
jgi:deazaflavin-dependent oxidoreductase (nitroreductase family)